MKDGAVRSEKQGEGQERAAVSRSEDVTGALCDRAKGDVDDQNGEGLLVVTTLRPKKCFPIEGRSHRRRRQA
ncbi:hypothetical protein B296_00048126 [Ensete ventricosum]|uniref:Uncharacterized protein n=1 Tax=Ensete ventricosum TaxID=4639 RepID=A0A426YL80_ENSVE|nr:hypothetical protein B296_00048126 [Ensete ventricosum]